MAVETIIPQWAAPSNIRAFSTLRIGGVSTGPYASLNLGLHVGDEMTHVVENRLRVQQALAVPAAPVWLNQVHGVDVVKLDKYPPENDCADASFSYQQGTVCVVMTADCLPVLLCDRSGHKVAAVHAGWRGLANGVLEATVEAMRVDGGDLLAWLGPAIGANSFEVGTEVVDAFVSKLSETEQAFKPHGTKWLADIYGLARQRLARLGVGDISGGDYCTFSEPERFFSYRRDGVTGRMATMIWMDA